MKFTKRLNHKEYFWWKHGWNIGFDTNNNVVNDANGNGFDINRISNISIIKSMQIIMDVTVGEYIIVMTVVHEINYFVALPNSQKIIRWQTNN